MTTTARPTRTRPVEGTLSPSTIRGQITALEHQRDDLLREIAGVDEKQRVASAEADAAERALAEGDGSPEAVTSAQARANAFARKAVELRAKVVPIEEAIAPKRAAIARVEELQRLADMARSAAALWKEVERRRAKASAAIQQALASVVEPQRELAALQESFSSALGRDYSTDTELDDLIAELKGRGATELEPVFTKHSFSTMTGSIKGWLRTWKCEAAPLEWGHVLDTWR